MAASALQICAQTQEKEEGFKCPLLNARQHIDSAAIKLFGTEDLKLIISSSTDSLVKAPADGVVLSVLKLPGGLYELVFQVDDFYFWFSGLQQTDLKGQQNVQAGQALGKLKTGNKLELLLFDEQQPVHPLEYLPCFPQKD